VFNVRVTHASGMLEGKYTEDTVFPENDHRRHRPRSWLVNGVRKVRTLDFLTTRMTLGQSALKWLLAEPRVVSTLPNIYDDAQLAEFAAASDLDDLTTGDEPRPDGAFSIVEHEGSEVITHDGHYTICEAPTRLSFTLAVPRHFAGLAQIDVTITPSGSGSHLDFRATGAGPSDAQQLWEKMIAKLAQQFGRESPAG